MRYSFFLLLLIASIHVNAQIAGRRTKDAIMIFDSIEVKPGDTIFLGRGSDRRGAFEYVYQPPNAWVGTPEESLARNFANTRSVIKHFKNQKSKRAGEKVVAVVNFGGFNCVADLEPAIEAGEILAINGHNFNEKPVAVKEVNQPTTQVNVQQQSTSKADELKKLKELLDSGVLSQDEYNTEKKKLLDKN
jgi:hypothetical protein